MCLFRSKGNFDIMSNIIEKGVLNEFWRSVNSPTHFLMHFLDLAYDGPVL